LLFILWKEPEKWREEVVGRENGRSEREKEDIEKIVSMEG